MDYPKLCTTRLLNQNFGVCISPQDVLVPFFNNHGTNYYRPWKLCEEIAKKDLGSTIDNKKDKFTITLDVQHFLPNEVSVKVNDREVTIEGRHEERQDDHGFISRQFVRRYALPKDCLLDTLTSTLSSDGVLIITANKKISKEIKADEKVIPIKTSGPCKKTDPLDETTKTITDNDKINKNEKKIQVEKDKAESQCMLKEDHCRLLKPEFLKEAASASDKKFLETRSETDELFQEAISGTEKLLTESRKETDELMKLISAGKTMQGGATGKLDEVIGQCKTAISDLKKDKIADASMTSISEMSSTTSSMISETIESKESSSFMSMSSSIKAASEKTSDIVSEIISAELKEAAENI